MIMSIICGALCGIAGISVFQHAGIAAGIAVHAGLLAVVFAVTLEDR